MFFWPSPLRARSPAVRFGRGCAPLRSRRLNCFPEACECPNGLRPSAATRFHFHFRDQELACGIGVCADSVGRIGTGRWPADESPVARPGARLAAGVRRDLAGVWMGDPFLTAFRAFFSALRATFNAFAAAWCDSSAVCSALRADLLASLACRRASLNWTLACLARSRADLAAESEAAARCCNRRARSRAFLAEEINRAAFIQGLLESPGNAAEQKPAAQA